MANEPITDLNNLLTLLVKGPNKSVANNQDNSLDLLGEKSDVGEAEDTSDATILFWTLVFIVGLLFFWIFVIVITQDTPIKIIASMLDRTLQTKLDI